MRTKTKSGGGGVALGLFGVLLSCEYGGAEREEGLICGLEQSGEVADCVRAKDAVLFAGVEVSQLEVVDLDGDGDADLLTENGWMVLQEGGQLRVQRVPYLPPIWDQLQVGDLEGDGVPDVLLLSGGRVVALSSPVDAPQPARFLPFDDGVELFRATDLDGDGRSEIATVRFDVLREDHEFPGPWNVLEVWGRQVDGSYAEVRDWRVVGEVQSASQMEVIRFEPESCLDFCFPGDEFVNVWAFGVEDHLLKGRFVIAHVYTRLYALRDVLQRGRRIAVSITTPYLDVRDYPDVVVHDWRDRGPILMSPLFDEQAHALATGNIVGDARHEILVAVSRDGRPYLDVRCIGNREARQFEVCGSVALEHVPEQLAVLALDDQRGSTIVYAADGKLYRLDMERVLR